MSGANLSLHFVAVRHCETAAKQATTSFIETSEYQGIWVNRPGYIEIDDQKRLT